MEGDLLIISRARRRKAQFGVRVAGLRAKEKVAERQENPKVIIDNVPHAPQ